MNGRVYDYNVGRFTSVDPLIQGHGNSQGLQPYSYVMNNPLGYTDPSGYSSEEVEIKYKTETEKVATTGSRIRNKTKTTTSGTVTKADGSSKRFSFSQVENGAISGKVSGSWSKSAINSSNIDSGSPQQIAVSGESNTGEAASTGLVGKIDKSQLGKDEGNLQDTFDEAYKFFENDESNQGEKVGFDPRYAISIRNASNHDETYAPVPFKSFDEAIEYAGKEFGKGYEKVWVFGYHQGGRTTIYKPATFSNKRFSGVERTIRYLAHESYHYVPQNPNRIRRHPNEYRMQAFDLVSEQAIQRYRDLRGRTK